VELYKGRGRACIDGVVLGGFLCPPKFCHRLVCGGNL